MSRWVTPPVGFRPIPRGTRCANGCGRPATEKFYGDAWSQSHSHPAYWCRICVLEVQITHARERAAALPALEEEFARLVEDG